MKINYEKLLLSSMLVLSFVMVFILLASPQDRQTRPNPENPTTTDTDKPSLVGKKIAWINSYHKGYIWSDSEYRGSKTVINDTGIIMKQFFMNAKIHDNDEYGYRTGDELKLRINRFGPDIIIAADDPAQRFLIVPHFKGHSTPVVFCGVNWDVSEYGYPAPNITGMIEVDLLENLLGYLHQHAKGEKTAFVAGNDLTERKILAQYNERFFDGKLLNFLAKENTFAEFSKAFLNAQEEADIIILSGNGSIVDWDDQTAIKFFSENTTKPTGTVNNWLNKYVLVAYSRVPEEQGEWAAKTAMRILSGTSPQNIPITQNKIGKLYINLDIAEKMNVTFLPSLLKNASLMRSNKTKKE